MTESPIDLLGIGFPKEFIPYETEDGWLVILPGEEDGRRGDKQVYAVSHVEIRLDSTENLTKCIRHLEESDRRLRFMKSNPWDWQRVQIKNNTVRFGVAWYSKEFFEERKDAWFSDQHRRLYLEFGADVDDFTVTHELGK
jgi:hypothetical protein